MREAVASKRLGARLGRLGLCVVAAGSIGGGFALGDSKDSKAEQGKTQADPVATGAEIFHREWMPNDPRGHGGDGLGPAFNDSSCIACHNAGGSGGAGPVNKNIDILSASSNGPVGPTSPTGESPLEPLFALHAGFRGGSKTVVLHKFGTDPGYDAFRSKLLGDGDGAGPNRVFGPGIAPVLTFDGVSSVAMAQGSFVGVSDGLTVTFNPTTAAKPDPRSVAATARMAEVRRAVLANRAGMAGSIQVGSFVVARSQRNPTPLFGLGLIDAIPESAILTMATLQARHTPEIAGRAARVADGRVGRLGWKGQTANSEDFVLNACAVEVGLEVPGHSQSITPQAPRYKGPGLDLTKGECDSLVAYVRALPRPVERATTSAFEAKFLGAGKEAFAKVGCAGCHSPKLGEVEGLYSDLLLHDMGDETADNGSYDGGGDTSDDPILPGAGAGVVTEDDRAQQPQGRVLGQRSGGGKVINANIVQVRAQAQVPATPKGARKRDWRTPPLWGYRDSGPYLHDGRAQALEQAVALHGGQGSDSARKFFELSQAERLQLEAFLKSLVAPGPAAGGREVARAGE